MLNNISWTDYLIAIGIALVVYYLFIGARYYSDDIKDLISGKRKFKLKVALPGIGDEPDKQDSDFRQPSPGGFENTTNDEFIELEQLIERLKTVVDDASHRKMISEEFKQYLSMILKEYPGVANSHLRASVNELIISECQKYGTVELIENEVDRLW